VRSVEVRSDKVMSGNMRAFATANKKRVRCLVCVITVDPALY